MRRLFTTAEAAAMGITPKALKWGVRQGRWRRVDRGVLIEGSEDPSPLEVAVAAVLATDGVASGHLAGVLLGLDGVALRGPDVTVPPDRNGRRTGVRRRRLGPDRVIDVDGVPCTNGLQTLIDLARSLSDAEWEQAMESALRRRLVTVEELTAVRSPRVRRVMTLRSPGTPPTESLLETLMVQLIRTVPTLPGPTRQLIVRDADGNFVARVDLAWPELGVFVELDGEHHKGQPVHDARRETAVVAATGWLCARFTWSELTRVPKSTARRLADIAEQARRRPVSA